MQAVEEPKSEEELVSKARTGDPDAFAELVRRNRMKAYGVAYSLTQDHHLAEDVVQEALVRTFLHLGTLIDTSRFAPWLAQIVRNEAYMKLRKGGGPGRERPFSQWEDGYHLDQVLMNLSKSSLESAGRSGDPSAALLRKELLDGIRSLFHCLSARERQIFEAYFFDQLPPQHIAALLDTSVANIYNSISRSRAKIRHERIRMHISLYIEQRRKQGKPAKRLLAPPVFQLQWKE